MNMINFESFREYLVQSEANPVLLYKTPSPQLGLYQFTRTRLNEVANYLGVDSPSDSEFLESPEMQDLFFKTHISMILDEIDKNNLSQYIGTPVQGANKYPYTTTIQLWGLLAGRHLAGLKGLTNFLVNGIDASDNRSEPLKGTYISDYIAKFSDYFLKTNSISDASFSSVGIIGIILIIGLILAYK